MSIIPLAYIPMGWESWHPEGVSGGKRWSGGLRSQLVSNKPSDFEHVTGETKHAL